MVRSIGGLSIDLFTIKVLQINTCLYLAKGLAEYVAVLDIDEFFIPKGENFNFIDVLNAVNNQSIKSEMINENKSSKDIEIIREEKDVRADVHSHPFCYISIESEIVMKTNSDDQSAKWMGER